MALTVGRIRERAKTLATFFLLTTACQAPGRTASNPPSARTPSHETQQHQDATDQKPSPGNPVGATLDEMGPIVESPEAATAGCGDGGHQTVKPGIALAPQPPLDSGGDAKERHRRIVDRIWRLAVVPTGLPAISDDGTQVAFVEPAAQSQAPVFGARFVIQNVKNAVVAREVELLKHAEFEATLPPANADSAQSEAALARHDELIARVRARLARANALLETGSWTPMAWCHTSAELVLKDGAVETVLRVAGQKTKLAHVPGTAPRLDVEDRAGRSLLKRNDRSLLLVSPPNPIGPCGETPMLEGVAVDVVRRVVLIRATLYPIHDACVEPIVHRAYRLATP